MTSVIERAKDKIKEIVSPHDGYLKDRELIAAERAARGAVRARSAAEDQAAVDEAPEQRKARRDAERLAASVRDDQELARIEALIRPNPLPRYTRFDRFTLRLFEVIRQLEPISPIVEVNPFTDERKITNLPEIERQNALGGIVIKMRVEIRDTLWRLDSKALEARVDTLRAELEDAIRGTVVEQDLFHF